MSALFVALSISGVWGWRNYSSTLAEAPVFAFVFPIIIGMFGVFSLLSVRGRENGRGIIRNSRNSGAAHLVWSPGRPRWAISWIYRPAERQCDWTGRYDPSPAARFPHADLFGERD